MGRVLHTAANAFALVGGALVVLVAVVTVTSVAARWLAATPVPGDVELVQLGTAVALALFLPYCQLHGGHLIVDVFTARADARVHRRLEAAAHGLAAVVLALLATRAAVGVVDLRAARETSMVLGLPLWLAYAPMVPALALAALIALWGGARNARVESVR
jgi:TRAP-type C4-dicarboxylate transport system permease small subunit